MPPSRCSGDDVRGRPGWTRYLAPASAAASDRLKSREFGENAAARLIRSGAPGWGEDVSGFDVQVKEPGVVDGGQPAAGVGRDGGSPAASRAAPVAPDGGPRRLPPETRSQYQEHHAVGFARLEHGDDVRVQELARRAALRGESVRAPGGSDASVSGNTLIATLPVDDQVGGLVHDAHPAAAQDAVAAGTCPAYRRRPEALPERLSGTASARSGNRVRHVCQRGRFARPAATRVRAPRSSGKEGRAERPVRPAEGTPRSSPRGRPARPQADAVHPAAGVDRQVEERSAGCRSVSGTNGVVRRLVWGFFGWVMDYSLVWLFGFLRSATAAVAIQFRRGIGFPDVADEGEPPARPFGPCSRGGRRSPRWCSRRAWRVGRWLRRSSPSESVKQTRISSVAAAARAGSVFWAGNLVWSVLGRAAAAFVPRPVLPPVHGLAGGEDD